MLCGSSCRVRRRTRRRRPVVLPRCRAKVHPSAFLCHLSRPVGRYIPPVRSHFIPRSRFILRRVTVYHRRSYRHHSHRDSHGRSQSRSCHRRSGRGSWRSLRHAVAVGRRPHGPDPLPQRSFSFVGMFCSSLSSPSGGMLSGITYGRPRTFTMRASRHDLNVSSYQERTIQHFSFLFMPAGGRRKVGSGKTVCTVPGGA